ncbi:TlpA family protein disulfide reductase [Vibrio paucivorans]
MKSLLMTLVILVSNSASPSPFIHGERVENIIIVSYFAEWCVPCRKEAKVLNSLIDKYPVVGINYDLSPDHHTKKIVEDLEIQFPVYKLESVDLVMYPLPPVLPTTYIIDKGEIAHTLYGEQSLESLTKALARYSF